MQKLPTFKLAVLIANGFDEPAFLSIQKKSVEMGVSLHIISPNQGLVNGWNGQGWGHNYAVDSAINTALGVDYDGVVMVSGSRSIDKLKLTAHTKRFVNSIMMAQKPVIVMGEGIYFLKEMETMGGYHMAQEGEIVCQDRSLLTGFAQSPADVAVFMQAMHSMIADQQPVDQAA